MHAEIVRVRRAPRSTASGMRPMPSLERRAVGDEARHVPADRAVTSSSGSGGARAAACRRGPGVRCDRRAMNESPCVRGIRGFTSAMTKLGGVDGGAHDVDRDAEADVAVRVGRAHLDQRHVDAHAPRLGSARGISERKTGMKSARPSCTASRTFSPMKNAAWRKRPASSGRT